MLVLSRKASERIHIGDNITIEVRRVAGNRVTLAIEAPRDIRILRGELEKAAKEFADSTPEKANQSPAREVTGDKAAAKPYIVSHRRLGQSAPLPANDLSDHGMTAYAVG